VEPGQRGAVPEFHGGGRRAAMTLLVIGNTALDSFFRVARLPLEGESVLAEQGDAGPGGKGFNQAASARRAGADVRFMTMLGSDAAGDRLAGWIVAEGLDGPGVLRRDGASDQSLILVGPSGENVIVTTAAAVAALPPETVLAAAQALGPGDGLLMQGNLAPDLTAAALAAARARGALTLLNPSPLRAGAGAAAAHADVLVMNEGEAQALDAPARVRVTSLGARGARLDIGGETVFVAAPVVAARDTTGAGDALAGVFAAWMLAGRPPEAALAAAVRAASATVARVGAGAALPGVGDLAALTP